MIKLLLWKQILIHSITLLKIAKKDNAAMIYASSGATYGSMPSPQTEGHESPENPYGFSKLMMDQIASQYSIKKPRNGNCRP